MYNHSYFYFVVIYDLTPGKNTASNKQLPVGMENHTSTITMPVTEYSNIVSVSQEFLAFYTG